MDNANIKRYLKSTLITFLAGFLPTLGYTLTMIQDPETITVQFAIAALVGAANAGFRLVLKAGIEKLEGRI